MSNRKFRDLPLYTGNTSGTYLILNNSSQTTTHKVTKETLLDGNNTFHGNQVISGSLFIESGSLFSQNTGSSLVSYDQTTGELFHTTYQSALPAIFAAGGFYSTQTQSGSANQSGSFTYTNTLNVNTVHIESGSHIVCDKVATYNIQFSVQIVQGSGAGKIAIWLKKNGVNVPNTATYINVPSNSSQLFALNLWDSTTNVRDYYELIYQSDSPHTTYSYVPSTGNIPASPSIIITVNQIR